MGKQMPTPRIVTEAPQGLSQSWLGMETSPGPGPSELPDCQGDTFTLGQMGEGPQGWGWGWGWSGKRGSGQLGVGTRLPGGRGPERGLRWVVAEHRDQVGV